MKILTLQLFYLKKYVAFGLAIFIVLGTLPLSVFAETDETDAIIIENIHEALEGDEEEFNSFIERREEYFSFEDVDDDGFESLSEIFEEDANEIHPMSPPFVRVRFHPNGGQGRILTRYRLPTERLRSTPNIRHSNSDRRRVGWFTTPDTIGGARIRSHNTPPNHLVGHSWYLFARWTNPTRHRTSWWRPANVGPTTIRVENFNLTPADFQTGAVRGLNNWTNSAATVQFSRNSSSNNRVRVEFRDDANPDRMGRRIINWRTGTRVRRWTIELYRNPITRHANSRGYNRTDVIANVMTHELGNALGLRDNPIRSSPNHSVMNNNRNRSRRDVPTPFDVTSIRMIYN